MLVKNLISTGLTLNGTVTIFRLDMVYRRDALNVNKSAICGRIEG